MSHTRPRIIVRVSALRPSLRTARRPAAMLAIAFALSLGARQACADAASPKPVVTVATVQRQDVAPSHKFIGHVTAIQAVKIVPRVTAFIEQVPVKQGSDVKAAKYCSNCRRPNIKRRCSRRSRSSRRRRRG